MLFVRFGEIRVAIVHELCSRNEKRGARDATMYTDATYDSIVLEDFCNHVK